MATVVKSREVNPPDEPSDVSSAEGGSGGPPAETGADNEAPVGQSDQPVLDDDESAKPDVTDGDQHVASPNPNPPAPPEDTPEKPVSPSTQPDEGRRGDTSRGDTEVGDSSGSDSTAVPSKPRKKTKLAREDIPDESSNSPGSEQEEGPSKPDAPRRIGGRRTGTLPGSEPGSRRQPTSRPELICRKYDSRWEVVLSANDECRIEEVRYHGRSLEKENGEYRLPSFAGSLSVFCKDGKHIDFPLFGDRPLIFKLRIDWKGNGRQVDCLTNGHFIVIAPSDWKRTGHVAVERDGCTDSNFLAHYFHRAGNDSTVDTGGFEECDLPLKDSQTNLVGETVFDDSEEGQLFGGNAPPLLTPPPGVAWARVGEEGSNSWTGDSFKPAEQALAEILDGRQGRFFLRVYDDELKLLDSREFRHLRSLKEIQVNDEPYTEYTILAPSSTGHLPTKVRFIRVDGEIFHPILPSEVAHTKAEGGSLIVDPHPSGDIIRCALESETGHVDIVLHLPRIWWKMKHDASESGEWRDTPLTVTRQEFREYADMGAAMRLRLPRRIRSVGVGFDDESERKYRSKTKEDDSLIPLADFADYSQIDQRLNEDALLNVECDGATLALIRISRDPIPKIISFTCEPATVIAGEQATLRWTTRDTEAGGVAIEPDVGAVKSNGSVNVTPLKTTAYTLRLTASGLDDVTKAVTAAVIALPRPDDEPFSRRRSRVRRASGGYRYGKGFSFGELRTAGLRAADAKRRSMLIDKHRRTIHPANIDKIRSLIDA